MPRYNVQNEKGEWACFSSIVDDFVTEFMPRDEYQAWRIKEYGTHCGEIEHSNQMSYDEAIQTILCQHGTNLRKDGKEGCCACDECKYWIERRTSETCCSILEHKDEVMLEKDIDDWWR